MAQLQTMPIQQQQSLIQPQQQSQYQMDQCDIKPVFPSAVSTVQQNQSNFVDTPIVTSSINVSHVLTHVANGLDTVNTTSGINTNQIDASMLHQAATNPNTVASFLVTPGKRAESFVVDEVKVMLKEIEARKHILLSISPSTNRLKRRAWEEVAISMASRWPHSPRRTADQVKKKWENLVSKTKRKVRAGHITPDLDWNETNAAVMQFLTQHSHPLRLRYATQSSASLLNLNNPTSTMPINSSDANSFNLTLSSSSLTGYSPSSATTIASNSFPNSVNSIFQNNLLSNCINSNSTETMGANIAKQDGFQNSIRLDSQTLPQQSKSDCTSVTFLSPVYRNSTNDILNNMDKSTIELNNVNGNGNLNDDVLNQNQQLLHINDNCVSSLTNSLASPTLLNVPKSFNDSFLPGFNPFNPSLMNFNLTNTTGATFPDTFMMNQLNGDLQKELTNQFKSEHLLRMDILNLQKQAWQLHIDLLKQQIMLNPAAVVSSTGDSYNRRHSESETNDTAMVESNNAENNGRELDMCDDTPAIERLKKQNQ